MHIQQPYGTQLAFSQMEVEAKKNYLGKIERFSMFILVAVWINSIYYVQNIVDCWNALIQGLNSLA